MGFHNIHEIEQFWRVSLEHFKFSVNLLFLKSGKMDRKIDINGKTSWGGGMTEPSSSEWWKWNDDDDKPVAAICCMQLTAICAASMLFFFKVKKKIFHTFDQNLRCAWRNKKFVNRKKSLKIALKSLAKYVGMLYYKSTNK